MDGTSERSVSLVGKWQWQVDASCWISHNALFFILWYNDLPLCSPWCSKVTKQHIGMLVILATCMAEKMTPIHFHSEFKVKSALDFDSWSCLHNQGLTVALSEITKKLLRSCSYIFFSSNGSNDPISRKTFLLSLPYLSNFLKPYFTF